MNKIYSYVLRYDDGGAPNPFWNICTLTICKPIIRKNAQIEDWVIGTGSKNTNLNDGECYDFTDSIVYAMKITDIKSLKEYDDYCNRSLPNKIPNWKTKDWRLKVGDCIYDYSKENEIIIRKGVHNETNREKDLSGQNALLSNHFYYFGQEARCLPAELKGIIKKNQGHKIIKETFLIEKFESWITQFEKNKLYSAPQMSWLFNRHKKNNSQSVVNNLVNNKDRTEEISN